MSKHGFKNNYPQITLLVFVYALSFAAIAIVSPDAVAQMILPFGILGIIITGLLYTYGFTSAIATVLFPLFALQYNPYLIALVGSIGALVGDSTIMRFIKGHLHTELHRLSRTRVVSFLSKMPGLTHPWTLSILGVLVLSSPLPDELGAFLIAEGDRIPERYFSIISFCANTIGIFLLVNALRGIV